MITVTAHTIDACGLNSESIIATVQAVREKLSNNEIFEGSQLIDHLLGITPQPLIKQFIDQASDHTAEDDTNDYVLTMAQAVAETVVRNIGQPIDPEQVLSAAHARTIAFMHNPQHKWMFAKPEGYSSSTGPVTQAAVAPSLEIKVAVNADGKIKKGGKEVLAAELYKKLVLNSTAPLSNRDFVKALITELKMSKAGATTYAYNMKQKLGEPVIARVVAPKPEKQVKPATDRPAAAAKRGRTGGMTDKYADLYKKHVLEAAKPLDRIAYRALVVKQTGATEAAGNTAWYTMKAKLGLPKLPSAKGAPKAVKKAALKQAA